MDDQVKNTRIPVKNPGKKKDGSSTPENVNGRIDEVCDMLLEGKTKIEIKRFLYAKYDIKFRRVEYDLAKARKRLLEEDQVVDFVRGALSRLHTPAMVRKRLREEKGITGRSADRIIQLAEITRERVSRTSLVDAKVQNIECLREIIRCSDDDRIKINAIQTMNKLLGLDKVKVDMSVSEEREIDDAIKEEIKRIKKGRKSHKRSSTDPNVEVSSNGDDDPRLN